MSVGFRTGNFHYIVGTSAFLHAFFSTVSGRLEPAGWGSRFPALLGELYDGTLPAAHVVQARDELRTIAAELATLPPSAVIWDLENPAAQPPWGDAISTDIEDGTDLGENAGRKLLQGSVLVKIFGALEDAPQPLT